MNPLDLPCPQCHAAPGARCANYLGKHCAPHRSRSRPRPPAAIPTKGFWTSMAHLILNAEDKGQQT